MVAKVLVITSAMHLSILESRTTARKSQDIKSLDNKASAVAWLKLQS